MEPTYQIIGGDGQTYGPVTLGEMILWINDGRISPETNVSRSDHGGWFPASQFSELSFAATSAPVAVATPPGTSRPAATKRPVVEVDPRTRSGANWFYWIAALSLINSLIALTGSEWGFMLGLGITQVFDVLGNSIGGAGKIVVLVLDVLVVGVFALFGFFANKNHLWAFIVGMVLYALDGVIYVFASEWLSVAFHGFALFCIFNGLRGALETRKLSR